MLGMKMTVLVNIGLLQIIILVFTTQEIQANPLKITKSAHSNNTSVNFKLSDFKNLNHAKMLRKDLTDVSRSVDDLIRNLDAWVFTEIASVTNSSLNPKQLQSLEDSMIFLHLNISELSLELSNNSDIDNVMRRSKSIQNYLDNLEKELPNNTKTEYQLINEYLDGKSLIDEYYNLTAEKRKIDLKLEDEMETKLANNCIEATTSGNILKAVLLLDLIKIPNKIEYIAKQLNTDNAIKLGDKTRNITKSFMIYKVVYNDVYSLLIKDHFLSKIDELRAFKLMKSIKNGIINQARTPAIVREDAVKLYNSLLKELSDLAELKMMMISREVAFEKNDLTFLQEFIIADYRKASELFFEHVTCEYTLIGTLFAGPLFSETNTLKFALFLKYVLNKCRVSGYSTYENSINELPDLVRNIVFSDKVCISQPSGTRYLRLTNSSYDNIRYGAYVHTESYFVPQEIWKLKHVEDDVFIIENDGIKGTYLDTDLQNDDKSDEHAVYGWYEPPNHGKWRFDLTTDLISLYIKNPARNEYLYVSAITDSFAYTKSIMDSSTDYFKWKITNCTDVKFNTE